MSTLAIRDGVLRAKQRREYSYYDSHRDHPKRLFTREQAQACRLALEQYAVYIKTTLPTNAGTRERVTINAILATFPNHVPYDYAAGITLLPVIFRALLHVHQTHPKSGLGQSCFGLYDSWRTHQWTEPGEIGNNRRAVKVRSYTGV